MTQLAAAGISNLEEQLQQYSGSSVIVKVSGQNLEKNDTCDFQTVCCSLVTMQKFLQKENTQLIVVHGAGKQLDEAVKKAGLPNKKVNGLRFTNDAIYEVVEREMCRIKRELVEELKLYGAKAMAMPKHLVIARSMGDDYGGRVGMPIAITTGLLTHAANNSAITVASSIGIDYNGTIGYNINADDVAAKLTAVLKPKLLMNITPTGGILADVGDSTSVIPHLTLEEAAKLSTNGMATKVNAAKDALEKSPGTKVVITSPADIVYSLFGNSGTVLTYE